VRSRLWALTQFVARRGGGGGGGGRSHYNCRLDSSYGTHVHMLTPRHSIPTLVVVRRCIVMQSCTIPRGFPRNVIGECNQTPKAWVTASTHFETANNVMMEAGSGPQWQGYPDTMASGNMENGRKEKKKIEPSSDRPAMRMPG